MKLEEEININVYFTALVILGALLLGLQGVLKDNILARIGMDESYRRILYIIIGASAFVLATRRDTYLPFLGTTVIPESVFELKEQQDATEEIKVNVPANSRVIYWATKPSTEVKLKFWKEAYGDYSNSGVALADGNGVAVLKIKRPSSYYVNKFGFMRRELRPHVHYRYTTEGGLMSPVETAFV